MPPLAREQQISKLRRGEMDFIVTTDVIGHGINLPLCSVVFAETDKYDGSTRRPLMLWEAAQIVGRAGRGGTPGFVACLRPFMGLSADTSLISNAIAVAAGGAHGSTQDPPAPHMPSPHNFFCPTSSPPAVSGQRRASKRCASASSASYSDLPEKRALKILPAAEFESDLTLDFAVMRPSFQDLVRLGASSPFLLPLAMQRWERVFIEKNRDWIRSGDMRTIVQRIDCVTSVMLGRASHGYSLECALFPFVFLSV
jgi:hypothetical protein